MSIYFLFNEFIVSNSDIYFVFIDPFPLKVLIFYQLSKQIGA